MVSQNQPEYSPLPDISFLKGEGNDMVQKFTDTLKAIGGEVIPVESMEDIRHHIVNHMGTNTRKITTIPLLGDMMELVHPGTLESHSMQDVDHAVIEAHFAVAENGALWVTEDKLHSRVLPFITQYLAVVVNVSDIVPTMHEAYNRIGTATYGFGTFIAGPSKTADIEQSLVLGAHGSRSMTVFLMK